MGFVRRWKPLVRAIAGLGLALPLGAQAQTPGVAASDAPAEWVRYAQEATVAIQTLLRAESETALRLKVALAEEHARTPIMLKVWADHSGAVARIECATLATDQARADLQALTIGQRLPGAMPDGMIQPMRIAMELQPVGSPETAR